MIGRLRVLKPPKQWPSKPSPIRLLCCPGTPRSGLDSSYEIQPKSFKREQHMTIISNSISNSKWWAFGSLPTPTPLPCGLQWINHLTFRKFLLGSVKPIISQRDVDRTHFCDNPILSTLISKWLDVLREAVFYWGIDNSQDMDIPITAHLWILLPEVNVVDFKASDTM